MKICITSQGDNLDAQVDPRFGRAQYFIIAESDTLEFESIENPNVHGTGGVGVQSGQLMAEKDVKVVLTGNVGPNAHRALSAAGIKIATGFKGSVQEAVESFKKGDVSFTDSATAADHSGMK